MIVYAQTQWKEHALGADRWKIIHTLELPNRLFHHFRCNLNEDYDFIAEHAEEMYVDRNRVTRGIPMRSISWANCTCMEREWQRTRSARWSI